MAFWDNIFNKKPKSKPMAFPVGEGLTKEQTDTAYETIAKQDISPKKTSNFWSTLGDTVKGIPQATSDVGKKFLAGGVQGIFKKETPTESYKELAQNWLPNAAKNFNEKVVINAQDIADMNSPDPEVKKLAQERIENKSLSFSPGSLENVGKNLVKKTVSNPVVQEKIAGIKDYIQYLDEQISSHPGSKLRRMVSRTTGLLPEVTGKKTMSSLTGSGKTVKTSKFGQKGDDISRELSMDYYGEERAGQEMLDDYNRLIEQRKLLKEQLKNRVDETPHLKFDADGNKIAYTEREKAILERRSQPPLPKADLLDTTTGEGRSLENLARQETKVAPVVKNLKNESSLESIIKKEPTPVKQKVTWVDYLRTPDRVLEKIGLKKEADALRTQHNQYLNELPKNIDKITEWSKKVSATGNKDIFRWLDGEAIDLKPQDKAVALEIRQWLKQWGDRLGIKSEDRITHYITHIFDKELMAKEFPEELAKLIDDKIPGEVYNPFMQKRLGALGYKQDTWAALDAYVKRATRKVYMDPALEQVKEASNRLDKEAFNYVKTYTNSINMRPSNIDNLIDNSIKQVVGYRLGQRPLLTVTRMLRQMTYRAMLGLNPASALKNLSQGINTYAKLGEKYTTVGYIKLFKKGAKEELIRENILNGGFIEDRALSSTKKAIEKFDKGLFYFFEKAEHINRGAAYFGAKAQGLSQGMSEQQAIEYAKKIVRDTQFVFGKIDTPLILASDLGKTVGQFQSFTVKQSEFLIEMARKAVKGDQKAKNFIGLIRYAVAGTLFVNTIGKAFNMKIGDLVPSIRFGTPPSLQVPVETSKAILDTPDKYGQDRDIQKKLKDVGNTLWGIFPGGIQAKKTIQGIKALKDGANIDASGRKMFDVGGTPLKNAQAVVFGKYAGQGARNYYDKEMTYAEQKIEQLRKSKNGKEELARIIKEEPTLAKNIVQVLKDQAAGITDEDKALKSLGVANKARAKEIAKQLNKIKDKNEKRELMTMYIQKKIITPEVAGQLIEFLNK